MVKAVEKPIVQQNGEEQEAAQKLKLDMSNIQTALNMMNTAKKDSVKRELEKESTDEENPPKTLKLDGTLASSSSQNAKTLGIAGPEGAGLALAFLILGTAMAVQLVRSCAKARRCLCAL